MKAEEMILGVRKMIVMDVQLDNLLGFRNFHMNMSYPKKIVNSYIQDEFLDGYPNFRYKKVNVLMGANATGKTSVGKMLMRIFNFIDTKQFEGITSDICDTKRTAFFSMDFVVKKNLFYRVETRIAPRNDRKYSVDDLNVAVRMIEIHKKDSYESVVKRIEEIEKREEGSYIEELEKVRGLSWNFEYPNDSRVEKETYSSKDSDKYVQILERTLRALDPSIQKVEKLEAVKDAYVIRLKDTSVIIQEGKLVNTDRLSSGTKAGIDLAEFLDSIINNNYGFYYCDEKFPYIHSDIEKAVLSVMIHSLHKNKQLFFTTHNTDILDLPLPKHSFSFLIKDIHDQDEPIKCVSASQYLKRNTDSLRNAVDNDLFAAAPSVELIYDLMELSE